MNRKLSKAEIFGILYGRDFTNDTDKLREESTVAQEIPATYGKARMDQRGALGRYVFSVRNYVRTFVSFWVSLYRCCKRDPYRLRKRRGMMTLKNRNTGTIVHIPMEESHLFSVKYWELIYD